MSEKQSLPETEPVISNDRFTQDTDLLRMDAEREEISEIPFTDIAFLNNTDSVIRRARLHPAVNASVIPCVPAIFEADPRWCFPIDTTYEAGVELIGRSFFLQDPWYVEREVRGSTTGVIRTDNGFEFTRRTDKAFLLPPVDDLCSIGRVQEWKLEKLRLGGKVDGNPVLAQILQESDEFFSIAFRLGAFKKLFNGLNGEGL